MSNETAPRRAQRVWVAMSVVSLIGATIVVGLDVAGASTSGGESVLTPITPCRLLDTRPSTNVGDRATPIQPGETFVVRAVGTHGNCTIPGEANALQTNVTAIGATETTFITMWAGGAPRPVVSSLNPFPGEPPTPNAVTVPLSGTGSFSMYSPSGTVDVIVDVVGYFADHDHDDFLTGPEIDTAIDTAIAEQVWSAPGSVEFAAEPFIAGAIGGTHGWELPNSGAPAIETVFELPPGYPDDGDIAIEIAWAGSADNTGACTAVLRGSNPVGLQIGSPTMLLPWEWVGGDASPDLWVDVPAPPSNDGLDAVIQVSTMSIEGSGLRAGDTLSVGFVRFAVADADTCTDSLFVTSVSAGPAGS